MPIQDLYLVAVRNIIGYGQWLSYLDTVFKHPHNKTVKTNLYELLMNRIDFLYNSCG